MLSWLQRVYLHTLDCTESVLLKLCSQCTASHLVLSYPHFSLPTNVSQVYIWPDGSPNRLLCREWFLCNLSLTVTSFTEIWHSGCCDEWGHLKVPEALVWLKCRVWLDFTFEILYTWRTTSSCLERLHLPFLSDKVQKKIYKACRNYKKIPSKGKISIICLCKCCTCLWQVWVWVWWCKTYFHFYVFERSWLYWMLQVILLIQKRTLSGKLLLMFC